MSAPQSSQSADAGDFPYWLVALVVIGVGTAVLIAGSDLYREIFAAVSTGLEVTVLVTLIAFTLAVALGLAVALCGLSDLKSLRQFSRFYIELIRGIPVLVLLFYVAFVGAPAVVAAYNYLAAPLIRAGMLDTLLVREVSLMWRAIIALTVAYSAFIAEIFRAGIQSVDKGQVEAAKALGLSRFQRFRLIIFPQALRVIFPPLSNDFVAMVKDSSLVSVLGVADITQAAKISVATSFRYFETYSMVAYVYLVLTIGLSLVLRHIEKRMRQAQVKR